LLVMVMAAGACAAAQGQVLISEVVDGPVTGGNPKFVELFNASATQTVTLGAGMLLRSYNNGVTTANLLYDFGANDGANEVILLPGQTWTYAASSNNGGAMWTNIYGANQPSLFGPSTNFFFGNGDDVYSLEDAAGIVDIYGVPGERPVVGDTWNYQDSYARRRPNVCAPSATFDINQWIVGGSDALEAGAANDTGGVWTQNTRDNTSPNSHANICAAGNDCNNNGFPDANDIATGRSQDCNANQLPDECDISSGGSRDCDGNSVPDECQIAGDPALDCNSNGVIDSCELSGNDCNNNGRLDSCDIALGSSQDVNTNGQPDECEPFLFDCNDNGVEDATDIQNGTSQDCNGNSVPDECELLDGRLTDADDNGTPDACEGAAVTETTLNATVQPSPFGVRSSPNGVAFMNIEGTDYTTFASYAGIRFDAAAAVAAFDSQYGAGNWVIDRAYLHLMQSNAGFTVNGPCDLSYSANDTVDLSPDLTPEVTFFENRATDFADSMLITNYNFNRGQGNLDDAPVAHPNGDGARDGLLLYSEAGPNNVGQDAVGAALNSAFGAITLLIDPAATSTAATYAGYTNNAWRGPSLVLWARESGGGCPACPADYNQDGGVDGADVEAFYLDWEASEGCSDTNQDGGVDGGDVETFFSAWEAGGC
jgi:hypothetical protein